MEVKLGNCRIVKVDDMNLSVEQYKVVPQSKNPKLRHDGEKFRWTHIGFYQNIHQALKKIIDAELMESNSKSATGLLSKLEELYSEVKNVKVPKSILCTK